MIPKINKAPIVVKIGEKTIDKNTATQAIAKISRNGVKPTLRCIL